MSATNEEIRICKHHQTEEKVPLIWTFQFMGSEYWCPACGDHVGMLGAGDIVKLSLELENSAKLWKDKGTLYLRALHAIKENGRWEYKNNMRPFNNLPESEQKTIHDLVNNWEYKFKL